MVRVSFGIYNSMEDVKFFAEALREIILKKDKFESEYFINSKGDYEHKEFKFTSDEYFCLSSTAEREILG